MVGISRGRRTIWYSRPRATPAPPRPGARRPQGRRLPAGALLLRGVSCSLPPCAFVPLFHTRARRAAGGLQHACARSGLCVRARARGPPPGTGVGEAHTRLADDPLGPARGQQTRCVRARPAAHLVFSLTHTLTVARLIVGITAMKFQTLREGRTCSPSTEGRGTARTLPTPKPQRATHVSHLLCNRAASRTNAALCCSRVFR